MTEVRETRGAQPWARALGGQIGCRTGNRVTRDRSELGMIWAFNNVALAIDRNPASVTAYTYLPPSISFRTTMIGLGATPVPACGHRVSCEGA